MIGQETGSTRTINEGLQPGMIIPAGRRIQDALSAESEEWLMVALPRLHRLARLRGVPPDAIEDVVQETLLEAWKHLDCVYAPEGLFAWLDEICRNICRRYARKQSIAQQRSMPLRGLLLHDQESTCEVEYAPLLDIPDRYTPDPFETVSQQDLIVLLDRALGLLPGPAREVVTLCYLLELPQREAAGRLGITISALEARLHRARRQLRQFLSGPLRAEAESFGLPLDQALAEGWQETRLWCSLCGQHRLSGMFLPQADGSVNLHMQCFACVQRYGLTDVDSSNVHSKGLVQLEGLRSFGPAWKRTMQATTQRLMQALVQKRYRCPYCGTAVSIQIVDAAQKCERENSALSPAVQRYPYQFWVCWKCPCRENGSYAAGEAFVASELVYWSHPQTRQFMLKHPRWVNEPDMLVEYAGQPAIRFQMADINSTARLTVLAHRSTLRVLDIFGPWS